MIEVERAKIAGAISLGTDVICDVSMAKNLKEVHSKLMEGFDVPFGVVTAYECYIEAEKDNLKCSASKCIETFKEEVLRGFDIITIHATVFKNDLEYIKQSNRIILTTSRGGMLMLKLMETNGYENPFYTHFDEILKICKEYEVYLQNYHSPKLSLFLRLPILQAPHRTEGSDDRYGFHASQPFLPPERQRRSTFLLSSDRMCRVESGWPSPADPAAG